MNTARYSHGEAGAGSNTATLAFGGSAPLKSVTEAWNGSAWTEVADLSTARDTLAQGTVGTSVAAIGISGGTPSATPATEEWNLPEATKTLTVS